MLVGRKMSTVCLVVWSLAGPLAADEADDFLRFLEARDESIASYEIKLRQFSFDIALDDYEDFKKSVEQLEKDKTASLSPSRQAEQLVQRWSKKDSWLDRHTKQYGERFKETLVSRSGGTDVTIYDGRLYYDYSQPNRQLDIHATIPNIHHTNLADLGLTGGGPRGRGKVLSFEQNEKAVQCVISFSDDNSRIMTQEYNHDFALCHSHYEYGNEFQNDDYYLFHEEIGGYPVPRVKINISPIVRRNQCSVWILVIEDVRFNHPLTDEDLSLGELPDNALVVDYRFKPKNLLRYSEYLQAADNPDAVQSGRSKPESMLEFLKSKRGQRGALATRDSRIGQIAPRPHIQRWLSGPGGVDTWPPQRFTVVNFWSIGCGFCVHEVPDNNELAQWLRDQGALFFSIHAATKEYSTVTDFMENHEVKYVVGLDEPGGEGGYWNSATFAEYGVNAVPKYVTIAKDGRVLSYDRTPTREQLQRLMAGQTDQIGASARNEATQRLDVIPKGWLASNLEPNSRIQGRFFVFRPETPDPDLHKLESAGDAIDCQWTRHSADGQTVYEVMLTAKTPDWGQTLKGEVALVARYGDVEEMVNIPYELRSRSLAECVSDILWLGPAEKGEAISRKIVLQRDPHRNVTVKAVSVPPDFHLNIPESGSQSSRILVECVFSSRESGLHGGTANLLARDSNSNEQPLKLGYWAFVRP